MKMNTTLVTLLAASLALATVAAHADVELNPSAIESARAAAAGHRNVLSASVNTNIKIGPASSWTQSGINEISRETITAPGAGRIGLYAATASLPAGSSLTIISGGASHVVPQGLVRNGFTVPLQPGEKLTLEVRIPAGTRMAVNFHITSIDVAPASPVATKSSSKANAKAAAPAGCRDAVNFECKHDSSNDLASRSTVNLNLRFSGYVSVCTGVLVNGINTTTNYILTAQHCRGTETIVDFTMHWGASANCGDPYWNLIAASDYAKATTSGATLVMEHNDLAMYRIGDVPAAATAWRAGFDASGSATGARFFGIHHASNLPKHWIKATNNSTYLANQPADQWIITSDYTSGEDGIVRTGSSGSGLFDVNQNILGTLYGGDVESCDAYGDGRQELAYNVLSVSWLGGGTPSTSLKPWLDPGNSGHRSNAGAAVGAADGACGSSNGGSFSAYPTTGLCAVGSPTANDSAGTDGAYNWTCGGVAGGAPASCSATRDPVITGTCGSAANQSTASFPAENHCAAGTLTTLDTSGTDGAYNWSCNGSNGGGNAGCAAPKSSPGSCGTATSSATSAYPSSNLCASGSPSATDSTGSDGSFNWSCSGSNGGVAADCATPREDAPPPAPVDGSCGSAISSTHTAYPSSGLCASGTASGTDTTGGDGSYDWSCQGRDGGSTMSCSATHQSVDSPPADGGGSGGGAMNPAFALVALLLGIVRRLNFRV